ncbi:MAG: DNA internalization-related competence protein ComEC/Rec2 [Pseudomonadota bacterium]
MRSWMIGLLAGVLPVLQFPSLPQPWVTLSLAVLGLGMLIIRSQPPKWISGALVGMSLALFHGQCLLSERLPDTCVGEQLQLEGEIASLPRITDYPEGVRRQRFELRVSGLRPEHCLGPNRVMLSFYGDRRLVPGEHWRFPVKLHAPWGLANPGSHNMQAWYALSGINAVGHVVAGGGERLPMPPSIYSLPNRLRQQISERIASLSLSHEAKAILAAVTVADKSGIDASLWRVFQVYGINHLLVISGLHVGLVAAASLLLGRVIQVPLLLLGWTPLWLPLLCAFVAAFVYTALAGFSVSTARALLMLSCFSLAACLGRRTTSINNLLLAAVVLLALNPLQALGSGFWLSFSAVAVLLWLSAWQRSVGLVKRTLFLHSYMSLAMIPLTAWWFGGGSTNSDVANLIMIQLVGMWVVPLALLGVLALMLTPSLTDLLWRLAAWPMEQLLPLARAFAERGAQILYIPFKLNGIDLVLTCVGVALLAVPTAIRGKLLAAFLVLPMLLSGRSNTLLAGADRIENDNPLVVTVLDVGQGTAVVVNVGSRSLIYDTGGGDPGGSNMATAVILPFLRHNSITSIDTLIVSHQDNDHSAGVGSLLNAVPIRRVLYGGDGSATPRGEACLAGQAWRWPDGSSFQFLSPASPEGLSSNNSSCVLLIESKGHRLLLLGDIETKVEQDLVRYWRARLESDWLLVAHHGSRTSSSYALLKQVNPAIAVISSGYANRFGHPHPDVSKRLEQLGASIYNTSASGALQFVFTEGAPVQVNQYRQQVVRFWM